MRNVSPAFLVDTNVLVYAYDRSDGDKRERAIAVIEQLAANGAGALSVQVLGEFYVTVRQKIPYEFTNEEEERRITNYARSWTIFDVTAATVLEAARAVAQHRLSYWDALIWSAAKLNRVPNVLSEDFSDGRLIEGVRFLNPFTPQFDLDLLNVRA
jgi:predicted nucleic acid-binding protein